MPGTQPELLNGYSDDYSGFSMKNWLPIKWNHLWTGLNTFSSFPGHKIVGEVSIKYIYEVAKVKKEMDPSLKN